MPTLTPAQRDELVTVASNVLAEYRRRHQAIEDILQALPALRENRTAFGCNCRVDDFERWLLQQREQVVQAETTTAEMWVRADEACIADHAAPQAT